MTLFRNRHLSRMILLAIILVHLGMAAAATAFAENIPERRDTSMDSIPDAVLPPRPVPAHGRNDLVLLAVCVGALGMQLSCGVSRARRSR